MKKEFLKIGLPLVIAGLLTTGCGDEKADEENATNLEGTWTSSECRVKEDGDRKEYEKEIAVFDGGQLTYRSYMYEAAGCTDPMMSVGIQGEYITGEEAGSTDVEGASPLNLTVKAYLITAHSEDAVKHFNEEKACGFSDWSLDESREVSNFDDCFGDDEEGSNDGGPEDDNEEGGDQSDGEGNDSVELLLSGISMNLQDGTCQKDDESDDKDNDGPPPINATWYHIFKATESELFWGDEGCAEMSSNSTRPTALRLDNPWVK